MIRRLLARLNVRYRLSQLVPMPMRSTYGREVAGVDRRERATWVQWRGRVFLHRIVVLGVLFTLGLFLFAGTAFAQAASSPAPGFFSDLTVAQVATAIGIFSPLIVAVIVKSTASTFVLGVVGTLAVAVNAIVALLVGTNAPDTVTLGVILTAVLPALAAHLASYRVAWQPTGLAAGLQKRTDPVSLIGPGAPIGTALDRKRVLSEQLRRIDEALDTSEGERLAEKGDLPWRWVGRGEARRVEVQLAGEWHRAVDAVELTRAGLYVADQVLEDGGAWA